MTSAILRDASSIISSPSIAAPRDPPASEVHHSYASRMFSAWSKSACPGGLNTSLITSTCVGCSTHLPSKPSAAARPRHPGESVQVLDRQVGAVDGLLVVGACGHEDRHEDVVVGVADVVSGRLFADDERFHLDRGHEVRRSEDQGLDAVAGLGDLVQRDQPAAVSICASMPMRPTSSPVDFSICVSSMSRARTCAASWTFGSMMQSSASPAPSTTSTTSR